MDDREQVIAAAKQRMAAFRLRQAQPTINSTVTSVKPAHARSHSRTSSTSTFSTINNGPPTPEEPTDLPPTVPNSPSPRSRPNSHHRRRSSVSTRRESAEMMGVAPPPESIAETTSDPSELRRLALWALEGKNRSDNAFIGGFTKVEIPELNTPEAEGNLDTLPAKPKPTLSAFGMGSSLAGKRDSFGKLLVPSSSSLKDQLHTLVEEEEEEEEEKERAKPSSESNNSFHDDSPFRDEAPPMHPTVQQPIRHRPTNLTLRPLSLTPESLPMNRIEALPTPSPTPSPRVSGLRSLTLTPSPSPVPSHSSTSSLSSVASRRQSLSVSPSSSPQPPEHIERRMSLDGAPSPTPAAPGRKSSISYKRSTTGDHQSGHLPTPGPTPTSPIPPQSHILSSTSSPPTSSSLAGDLERPLSPTEQAFLFRSHASLLCRISDLEKAIAGGRGRLPPGAGISLDPDVGFGIEALRDRSRSNERPISVISSGAESEPESVSSLTSQPSNEMLQLLSDLKTERDGLMRDVEGWRTRTTDLEKQIGTLTRRVEAERREGWVVRERLGLVEVEKKRARDEVEKVRLDCRRLEKAVKLEEEGRVKAIDENVVLTRILEEEKVKREKAEQEVERLRMEMDQLRARAEQADADLQALLITPKVDLQMQTQIPMPIRRFSSVDSGSTGSTTDVEEYVPVALRTLNLKAVKEEEEERDLPKDVTSEGGSESESDNDELAHYEDDDLDDDMIFSDDQTSSSFGSLVRSNSHLLRLDLAAVTPAPPPSIPPSHAKNGSMEKGWSFSHATARSSFANKEAPKVDRFFECLDGLDESDIDAETGRLPTYDSTTAKLIWRDAMQVNDEDEMPPFVLPAQPSPPRKKEWKEIEAAKLDVLAEEDEDEDNIVPFQFPASIQFPENESALDASKPEPVTPRPTASSKLVPTGTPTKHPKVRRTSTDLTIPGFKPYSGSVPILKPPPLPRRNNSPAKALPTTPTSTMMSTSESNFKESSPTLIPKPTLNPPVFTTPPKPRAVISGATCIPKPSSSPMMIRTPTKPMTASETKTLSPTPPLKTSMTCTPPVFIPQPKMTAKSITRSSTLTPSEPSVLTRLSIVQQTAAPAEPASPPLPQGLTAKLSQQMQNITSFWSSWSTSPSMTRSLPTPAHEPEQHRVRGYVSKERQVERLRLRLRVENALAGSYHPCTNCEGDIFMI